MLVRRPVAANPQIRPVPFTQLVLAGAPDAEFLGDNDQPLLIPIRDGDVYDDVGLSAEALPFV